MTNSQCKALLLLLFIYCIIFAMLYYHLCVLPLLLLLWQLMLFIPLLFFIFNTDSLDCTFMPLPSQFCCTGNCRMTIKVLNLMLVSHQSTHHLPEKPSALFYNCMTCTNVFLICWLWCLGGHFVQIIYQHGWRFHHSSLITVFKKRWLI